MFGRFGLLIPLTLLVVLSTDRAARAHALDAQAFWLPGQQQVRIEGWFDNGRLARGAKVRVCDAKGRAVAAGVLDQEGRFVFALPEVEALQVVVTASGGHRKELAIGAEELRNSVAEDRPPTPEAARPNDEPPAPVPLTERRSMGDRIKDLVIGIGFLLALAGFVLGLRNARRIRELKREAIFPRTAPKQE